MKYTKSSIPYLTILLFVVVLLPIFNSQAEKSQHVVIEVQLKRHTEARTEVANLDKGNDSEGLFLLLNSK
jgi:hypothetical protein